MRVLHTADIHIGTFPGPTEAGKNLRMRDTTNCMVALANSAMTEKPDLIIIAGDLFHRSRLWADEMLVEIQIAAEWLTDLSKVAPVCLLYGTPNHDNEEAFHNLSRAVPEHVHIFTWPERRVIQTASGDVQVCALPGFDRGFYRAQNPGVSREEENAVFSNTLSQIVMGLSAQCTQDAPCVLMAHYTVPGADLESGQVQIFSQSEPMLTVDTLAAADFDLVTLGHIHKPQLVNGFTNVYYSGAINRFNFNDEGQPRGFWYHELSDNALVDSRFVATPARAFCTIKLQSDEVSAFNMFGALPSLPEITGHIVRVLYSCTDEHEKALNKSAMERYLYEKGAFWVQEISPAEIIVTPDRKAMDEATSPEENLVAYLTEHGATEERIQAALELARPIIADAVASARDKRSTGVLRPVSIEVNNYRNYREASFDFSDVSMCTINGVNGAGKSSLFMDAIVDCLYEEPREAELTGWIRADDDARSGAITFTFAIGDQMYRVSRTRARSGKATLNLSEMVDGEWKNRSSERLRDTQDEITALLGMDIGTFKSCALIMQDQYGIFLEAGKEQRMETLAAMLGLGIYEAMEEVARTKAADRSREIKSAQEQMARYDTDLQRETSALEEKSAADAEIKDATACIDSLREKESSVNVQIAQIQAAQQRIDALDMAVLSDETALTRLRQQKAPLLLQQENLMHTLSNQDVIAEKAGTYEKTKAAADAMAEVITSAQREQASYSQAEQDKAQINADISAKNGQRGRLESEKKEKEQSVIALQQYKDSAQMRDATAEHLHQMEANLSRRHELDKSLATAREARAIATANWESIIASMEVQIRTMKQRADLLSDSKCIDPDNANCVFLADAIRSRDALPELEANLEKARKDGDVGLQQLRDAETEAATALLQVKGNQGDVTRLREEYDRHVRNAALYDQKSVYLDRIVAIDIEIQTLDAEIKALGERIEIANARSEKYQKLAEQLKTLQWEHHMLTSNADALKPYADELRSIPDTEERYQQGVRQLQDIDQMMQSLEATSTQARNDREMLKRNIVNEPGLRAELNTLTDSISQQDARKSAALARLGSAEMALKIVAQAKEHVAILRREVNALSEAASLYGELRQAFSRDGIPHNIIRSIIPTLESTSNNILSQMTGGKMSLEFVTERTLKSNAKKEVTTLDIFIQEAGRSRLPYLSKSGGEKVKVSLSVVLALAEIMSRRAGIQLGMLFIDEPPFLDDMGTQAYCDALEAIRARYPSHTIMAITHDPTMKARFPQSIDIVRTDEGSKVVYT